MTVYKYFIKTAMRHKWIILGYTAIFFILALISGSNTITSQIAFMEKSLDLGLVDNSNGDLSKLLIEHLGDKNILTMMEDDIEYIKEEIFLESVDAVIVIPEDFESRVKNKEASIEIYRDERKIGPIQVENTINKFLMFSNATYKNNSFDLQGVKDALSREIEVEVLKGSSPKNNQANSWFKYYFNSTGYVIIAIYVAVIGLVMADFNDNGLQDRTKISSKKFLRFNIEMYLGQVTVGVFITSIFILGTIILKGKYIGQVNFSKYILNISVFSFSILCFTFLINNITTSKFVINGISTVSSLGTSFISGVFTPQEFLSDSVLNIAKFFPTYYFVKINNMRLVSFSDISYEIFMQLLFGIAFLTVGLYFSKVRQKS